MVIYRGFIGISPISIDLGQSPRWEGDGRTRTGRDLFFRGEGVSRTCMFVFRSILALVVCGPTLNYHMCSALCCSVPLCSVLLCSTLFWSFSLIQKRKMEIGVQYVGLDLEFAFTFTCFCFAYHSKYLLEGSFNRRRVKRRWEKRSAPLRFALKAIDYFTF